MTTQNDIIIYQTDDGPQVRVLGQDDNVWLTLEQIGSLFEKSKATISEHISNIFAEGELEENSVVRKFGSAP
ncbi:hypothetical protein EH223_05160 [candidate division KSB1 bacterium]|nr:MAG: hypothetical protein EH223_05160 [candidate division KSB1 bacterium]